MVEWAFVREEDGQVPFIFSGFASAQNRFIKTLFKLTIKFEDHDPACQITARRSIFNNFFRSLELL